VERAEGWDPKLYHRICGSEGIIGRLPNSGPVKLKEFRVQNYRSVVDSGPVRLTDITVFIGANEAGKSSILQGLASIGIDSSYADFDLSELDGILKAYLDGDLKAREIPIVTAVFDATANESARIRTILESTHPRTPVTANHDLDADGQANVDGPEENTAGGVDLVSRQDSADSLLTVSKTFDGTYKLEVGGSLVRFPSRWLVDSATTDLKEGLQRATEDSIPIFKAAPNSALKPAFDAALAEVKAAAETSQSAPPILEALAKVDAIRDGAVDALAKEFITAMVAELHATIAPNFPSDKIAAESLAFLTDCLPKTVYFKTYERLEDEVSIEELKQRPKAHPTFVNFLKLAGIKLATVERLADDEKKRQFYLESGCGKATDLLRLAWKQEVLDVELRCSGNRLLVFTKNSKATETLLPPSQGSEGFQWFLGFFINFGAATNAEYRDALLLLDDPGGSLHPKGHKDLLSLFDQYLSSNVTTIYATHLPFLIPRDRLDRIRLVRKLDHGKSEVTEKFYAEADKDILFPLRAALGMTLADSLFVGEKTLVTEGLSDRILLRGMMAELAKREKRQFRALDSIEVLAGEGAPGTKRYALMLEIERLDYAVVLDNDDQGRTARTEMTGAGVPSERVNLLRAARGGQDRDIAIEDMFSLADYSLALQRTYGKILNMSAAEIEQELGKGTELFTNRAKRLLKKVKHSVDKVEVAYNLLAVVQESASLDSGTEANFLQLFDAVNVQLSLYESSA
jgi:predicted ATP-dependent endonuclease of OLD family